MEKFDSVILIVPHIGEYHGNNVFLRGLNADELKFLQDSMMIEYRSKKDSYAECIKDLNNQLSKIKLILQEQTNEQFEEKES
jgi:hypothetical protein